jgi:hypothetical protein
MGTQAQGGELRDARDRQEMAHASQLAGDIFVTRSRTAYEVCFRSPGTLRAVGTISIHVGIDSFRAALETIYPATQALWG